MNIKPLVSCGGGRAKSGPGRQIRADYTGARPKSNAAAIEPQDRPKALFGRPFALHLGVPLRSIWRLSCTLFGCLSCGAKGPCAKGRVIDQGPHSMDAKVPSGADDLSHTLLRI